MQIQFIYSQSACCCLSSTADSRRFSFLLFPHSLRAHWAVSPAGNRSTKYVSAKYELISKNHEYWQKQTKTKLLSNTAKGWYIVFVYVFRSKWSILSIHINHRVRFHESRALETCINIWTADGTDIIRLSFFVRWSFLKNTVKVKKCCDSQFWLFGSPPFGPFPSMTNRTRLIWM